MINQMASALFRFIAALGRNMIVANTFGSFALLILLVLGGFILSRGMLQSLAFFFILDAILQAVRDIIPVTAACNNSLLITSISIVLTEDVKKWWIWGYWISPLMYSQNAISTNEFLGKSWSHVRACPSDEKKTHYLGKE